MCMNFLGMLWIFQLFRVCIYSRILQTSFIFERSEFNCISLGCNHSSLFNSHIMGEHSKSRTNEKESPSIGRQTRRLRSPRSPAGRRSLVKRIKLLSDSHDRGRSSLPEARTATHSSQSRLDFCRKWVFWPRTRHNWSLTRGTSSRKTSEATE